MLLKCKVKKLAYFTMLLLVVLFILQCITAMWFANTAQNEYKKQFDFFADSVPVKVNKYTYNSGFFVSHEIIELNINSGILSSLFQASGSSESVVPVKIVTNVYNGILAGLFTGHMVPTIAVAKSTVQFGQSFDKIIKKIYPNKPFLLWDNVIYITGSGNVTISSPAANYEEAVSKFKLSTSGFKFTSSYDSDYIAFKNNFNLDNIDISLNSIAKFNVSNIKYTSKSIYSSNKLRVGDSNIAVDQINLINTSKLLPDSFKLGNILNNVLNVNVGDALPVANSNHFGISGLSYENHSNDDGKYFSTSIMAKVNKITMDEKESAGPLLFKAKLNHVLSGKLNTLLESYNNSDKIDNQKVFENNLLPILSDKPVFVLESLNIILPLGVASVSGNVTLDGFAKSENYTNMLKKSLVLSTNISLPTEYIRYLFISQLLYVLSMNGSDLDEESRDAINILFNTILKHQIRVWLKTGYITVNGNILSTSIQLESGVATVNNKKVKL